MKRVLASWRMFSMEIDDGTSYLKLLIYLTIFDNLRYLQMPRFVNVSRNRKVSIKLKIFKDICSTYYHLEI